MSQNNVAIFICGGKTSPLWQSESPCFRHSRICRIEFSKRKCKQNEKHFRQSRYGIFALQTKKLSGSIFERGYNAKNIQSKTFNTLAYTFRNTFEHLFAVLHWRGMPPQPPRSHDNDWLYYFLIVYCNDSFNICDEICVAFSAAHRCNICVVNLRRFSEIHYHEYSNAISWAFSLWFARRFHRPVSSVG